MSEIRERITGTLIKVAEAIPDGWIELAVIVGILAIYVGISTSILVCWKTEKGEKKTQRFKRNWFRFIFFGTLFGWAIIPLCIVFWAILFIFTVFIPALLGLAFTAVMWFINSLKPKY